MSRRPVTRRRTRVLALPLVIALAACGADDGRFDARADDVRSAIEEEDRIAAVEAIEALAIEGLAAHEAGALDDGELDEFARRIESLRAQVDALFPPTTTTTTTTVAPPEDRHVVRGEDSGDHGKGKRKKDKDDDEDDD